MKKMVAYGMYNKENSRNNFKKQVEEEIKNHKEWELKKIYIDYTKEKLVFGKLLNEIIKGNFNGIILKNINQLYKAIDYATEFFMQFFNDKKIEVIFLDEKLSTFDSSEEMQINLRLSMESIIKIGNKK